MTDNNPVANWYPDPQGKHELRYWDGTGWTDQVASHGKASVDPMVGTAKQVTGQQQPDKVKDQVERHNRQSEKRGVPTVPSFAAGTGLLDQPILVVNQKWKLFEVNTEFAIYDSQGTQIGAVRQVGQNGLKKVLRFVGNIDQYMTHKFQIVDSQGQTQLMLTRPRKFFKSRVIVQDGSGNEVGQIVQQNMIGKIRFAFVVNGQEIGGMFGENWRAWNFAIKDHTGTEVARITKTFEGLLKTTFTTADNYVLQVHQRLEDPIRQMTYAAAVAVDVALKQDARGVSGFDAANAFGG